MTLFPEAKIIKFTIDLEPHPQERIRGRVVIPRHGKPFVTFYKSAEERQHDADLKQLLISARNKLGLRKMTGPLRLGVAAYLPRPLNHFGTGKNSERVKTRAPEYHTALKDLDNLMKHLKDCATGILWEDDKQIFEYLPHTGKYWVDGPGYWLIGIQEI